MREKDNLCCALHLPMSLMMRELNLLYTGIIVAAVVAFVFMPTASYISDIIGRKCWFISGLALMAVFAFPFFLLIRNKKSNDRPLCSLPAPIHHPWERRQILLRRLRWDSLPFANSITFGMTHTIKQALFWVATGSSSRSRWRWRGSGRGSRRRGQATPRVGQVEECR